MSRIGKLPISIPQGVKVEIKGNQLHVEGQKGKLDFKAHARMKVAVEGNQIKISRATNSNRDRSLHGLTRTLIANMVQGVVEPWKKDLEIQGVGFRASKQGQVLNLSLGFSHPVNFSLPPTVQFNVDAKQTLISMSCADKELLGVIAAKIRGIRPPEPYKGKGVRYQGERVLRKASKAAGAAGAAGAAAGGKK